MTILFLDTYIHVACIIRRNYMIQYLKQNKLLLFFTIILNAISSLGFVLIAIVLQKILDTVIANDMQMFKRITVFTITYLVLLGIFLYLQSLFTKKLNCRIMYSIRSKMFNGIINQTIEDYNKKNTADYMSALNNDVKLIEDNYLLPLLEIIQYGIVFIASLGVMIYFDITMTICVVVAVLFMLIIPNIFGGILEKRQNAFSSQLSSFTNNIKDLLSGFEIIKSYSMKNYVKTIRVISLRLTQNMT